MFLNDLCEENRSLKSETSMKRSKTFKPHCMGVKSEKGIRRVNNSQRRTANDQISDAFVKIPFSKTVINECG